MRTRIVTETRREQRAISEPIPPDELEAVIEFQDALKSLKEGKDEVAKKKASETIQQQLVKQFERDLQQREQELATVEERVKSLRQQLDKRKAAKDDIITLRLKTIFNNADGLGFPGDDSSIEPSLSFPDPDAAREFYKRREVTTPQRK